MPRRLEQHHAAGRNFSNLRRRNGDGLGRNARLVDGRAVATLHWSRGGCLGIHANVYGVRRALSARAVAGVCARRTIGRGAPGCLKIYEK